MVPFPVIKINIGFWWRLLQKLLRSARTTSFCFSRLGNSNPHNTKLSWIYLLYIYIFHYFTLINYSLKFQIFAKQASAKIPEEGCVVAAERPRINLGLRVVLFCIYTIGSVCKWIFKASIWFNNSSIHVYNQQFFNSC